MPASEKPSHAPHWYWIPVRVLLVTFIVTLISFALCLLLGILGVVVGAHLRGMVPDLRLAYRPIALPAALFICAIVFISVATLEVRHFRQTRTLAGIERASRHA